MSWRTLAAGILLGAPALADVSLPRIFSDGVVLQRERRIRIFGFAKPQERVRVHASWGADAEEAVTDQDGSWRTTIVTPEAGGPFTIDVTGKNTVTVRDVMIGEVWLCSGQSNMEMPVAPEGGYTGVLDWEKEVANVGTPLIRIFSVENDVAAGPRDDVRGAWTPVTKANVGHMSATAYFFGRKLFEELKVPIGLVDATWGGTPAESWTSGITLARFPEYSTQVADLARRERDYRAATLENFRSTLSWSRAIEESDHGERDGFVSATFDDSSWSTMNVPGMFDGPLTSSDGRTVLGRDFDGIVWMRRTFELPANMVDSELELETGPIDDFAKAYFDGESIGSEGGSAERGAPRKYGISAQRATRGRHVIAVRLLDTGGPGGIAGVGGNSAGNNGVRLVKNNDDTFALGGVWRARAGADIARIAPPPTDLDVGPQTPTALYNAMIAPLTHFAIRGVIWYQGESNRPRAFQYKTLFPALIADWRARFADAELPFYFVQIAPFAYGGDRGEAAELREAQRLALEVPHTGMVVTTDIGDPNDIHPKNKQEVGRRLALWALARTYGQDVECSGPALREVSKVKVKDGPFPSVGNELKLEFDHASGFRLEREGVAALEVAGRNGKFLPATVEIDAGTLRLYNTEIDDPVYVRYAQGSSNTVGLYNLKSLPASPFQVGGLPWITARARTQVRWNRSGDNLTLGAPITRSDEGIPIGNGWLGALVWGDDHKVFVTLDRADVWDLREPTLVHRADWNWSTLQRLVAARDEKGIHALFDDPWNASPTPTKLPIGRFEIALGGVTPREYRLDLAKGEARVTLDKGVVHAFASAKLPVVLLRIEGVEPQERWEAGKVFVLPDLSKLGLRISARTPARTDACALHVEGPGGISYAIAAVRHVDDGFTDVALTVVQGAEDSDPMQAAIDRAASALTAGYAQRLAEHMQPFTTRLAAAAKVTIGDPALQTQYDLSRHLMLCASQRGSPPMALQGVWTSDAGLPAWRGDYHCDLNLQTTYSAYATAGLLDCGTPLFEFLWHLLPRMREVARTMYGVDGAVLPGCMALDGSLIGAWPQYALSPTNGAWIAEVFARHWRVTRDEVFLRDRAYPWCSAVGEGLIGLLRPDANGKLQLPLSTSPEIHDNSLAAFLAPDSNYDLAAMRALFTSLTEMARALHADADAQRWSQALAALDDFALDARGGLAIARGEPLTASHRHMSHALGIDLGLISIDHGDRDRAIVDATLDTILDHGTSAWMGYSFAWFAELAAQGGRPETALRFLRDYERAFTLRNGLHANGDQSEEGLSQNKSSVFTIEGNMLAMEAVHQMLLQSSGGVVRVFPATSVTWPEAAFEKLHAEGGFVVSARRSGGTTSEVRVRATVPGVLRLRDPFDDAACTWNRPDVVRDGADWTASLAVGQELVGTRSKER